MQHVYIVRFQLIMALSILFGCLTSQPSWAKSLSPAGGIEAPVSLKGHMSILRDPRGTLTIDDIASRRPGLEFKPIPSMLTEGYVKGAVWVRFSLSAPAGPRHWLLQVERPLIQQVTLYAPSADGRLEASRPIGFRPNAGDGDVAYAALFPIAVQPTETDYYIRLQSINSITTSLNIWQEEGYANYRRSDDWIMGVVIGAIGAMLFANLLFFVWLKDSLYLLYAPLLMVSGLLTLFQMGYASEIFHAFASHLVHQAWGVISCLHGMLIVLFLARLFELRRHCVWAWRICEAIVFLTGIAFIFALADRYEDVGLLVSRLQQLSFVFIAGLVIYLLAVRRQYQYALPAVAFLGVIAVLFTMQTLFTGANPFQLDGSLSRYLAFGTMFHLVLLSAAIAKRTQLAERKLREEKDRVIAISRSAEQDLTVKVRERTADLARANAALTEEVDRRHLLELKLRQSLGSVNDALAQQRDFVALVSHEFRAPLTVIAAAAENLVHLAEVSAGEVAARANRILRTVRRMSMLIENVLAGDRLDETKSPIATKVAFDLNEILSTVADGLDDDAKKRVIFERGSAAIVIGDRYLLEIVLQNLVQNALKYSALTSPVRVRLSTHEGVGLVEVADLGGGVARQDRDRIFAKYFRAAGLQASGSGLGLYIAKGIARQHGGDLLLHASNKSGSTFRLTLPLAGAQTETFPLGSSQILNVPGTLSTGD